jgi:RHH-type rel operon transcriptional repressor/antitoxin RelB
MTRQIAIRLSEETDSRLAALAARTGRTKTFYVREAIEAHLEDLEDYYLAAEVSERIVRGEESTISLDELMARYDLED